jgi:hypothetical protein
MVSQSATPSQMLVLETGGRWDDTTTLLDHMRIDMGGATFTGRVRVRRIDAPAASGSIRGAVNGDGTIARGTGFTVTRNAVGQYDIAFPAGTFAAPPVLMLTLGPGGASPGTEIREYATPTATLARILRYDNAGNNADGPFNFAALP